MTVDDTGFGSVQIDWAAEPVPNLAAFESYGQAVDAFEWSVPEQFNIATDTVARHGEARGRVAMYRETTDGDAVHTFWQFDRRSNEVANALADAGVERGDRVAVIGSRSDSVMIANLAIWKLGAISVPLSVLYGPDGLAYRLRDCEPRAVFAAADRFEAVSEAIDGLDSVRTVIGLGAEPDVEGVQTAALSGFGGSYEFETVETAATDPAMVLYTSGTTGEPKGVLQAHQALIGWLPSFQMCFELPWREDDPVLYVTPDLAWVGGLNLVLNAWHYGFPVFRDDAGRFDPVRTFDNIETWGLTRAVLVPAMLKPMSELDVSQWDLSLLSVVMSGSEPVSDPLYDFVTDEMGASLNEMYGQTEALHVVTSCSQWFDVEPGSMGYPAPGHEVAIVDGESGDRKPDGDVGAIAVERPDPVIFRELWNDPDRTEARFVGDWMNTGDLGYRDEDGRFWFTARDDDLILASGYRVAPAEVENSILQLDAVANVGVVGVDHERRGTIVKAFVRPAEDADPGTDLEERIQSHVAENLARYQYPREVAFVDELPTTVTGKIRRHRLEERYGS
ncbi:MAG: acyl-CoA synthetase [Salinirussus sp.]